MEQAIQINVEKNIVVLTINRPKALNAINKDVMEGLYNWFSEGYKEVPDVVGVIITGAGEKAFVAGADIKGFLELDAQGATAVSKYGHDTYNLIENFHVPVIAAIDGFALGGGCELSMACHLRVATEKSRFGQPEVNLGLVPGYGGTQRLIQLIGKGKALELLLTADMIAAQEAYSLGLVNHVVPESTHVEKSKEIIEKIATKGPGAVRETIRLVNAYFDKSADGFSMEYDTFGKLLETNECKEGVTAFIEKRKAKFRKK